MIIIWAHCCQVIRNQNRSAIAKFARWGVCGGLFWIVLQVVLMILVIIYRAVSRLKSCDRYWFSALLLSVEHCGGKPKKHLCVLKSIIKCASCFLTTMPTVRVPHLVTLDDFGAEILLGAIGFIISALQVKPHKGMSKFTSRSARDITNVVQGLIRGSESKGCIQSFYNFSTCDIQYDSVTLTMLKEVGRFCRFTQTFANSVVQDKCQNPFYCDLFVEGLPGMFAVFLVSQFTYNECVACFRVLLTQWTNQSTFHHVSPWPAKQPSKIINIFCRPCEAMTLPECQLPTLNWCHEWKRCFVAKCLCAFGVFSCICEGST